MLSVVASDATDRAARSSITSDAAVVEPAPWMPAMDTEFVIAVHESAAAAEHHLAERQRLRALYSGGGRGSNENSGDTLRALHAITYKCSECEGLIDHLAASRVAPTSLGCTGRGCSKNHRTPAYAVSQTRAWRSHSYSAREGSWTDPNAASASPSCTAALAPYESHAQLSTTRCVTCA